MITSAAAINSAHISTNSPADAITVITKYSAEYTGLGCVTTRTAENTAIAEKIQKYAFIPPAAFPSTTAKTIATAISTAAPILRKDDSRRPGNNSTIPTAAATHSRKISPGAIICVGNAAAAMTPGMNEGATTMMR